MQKIFVILDSMVIMQYQGFLEYAWQEHLELKDKVVVLVFVRPMIEELDRNKGSHSRSGVRRRCRETLGWIESNLKGIGDSDVKLNETLRACLDLKFYPSHRGTNADDRIIEYAKERGESVVICSGDYTLRLLAAEQGVKDITPLESQRIRFDEDTEVDSLKKDLEALRKKLPALSVRTSNGKIAYSKLLLPFSEDAFVSEKLLSIMSEVRSQSGRDSAPNGSLGAAIARIKVTDIPNWNSYSPAEIKRYEKEIHDLLRRSFELAKRYCSSPTCSLELVNDGASPANQVEVTISAPEEFQIVAVRDFIFEKLPRRPQNPIELARSRVLSSHASTSHRVEAGPAESSFRSMGCNATFKVQTLLHHRSHRIPDFILLRRSGSTLEHFSIEVTILTSELPKLVSVTIPVGMSQDSWDQQRTDWIVSKMQKHFGSVQKAEP